MKKIFFLFTAVLPLLLFASCEPEIETANPSRPKFLAGKTVEVSYKGQESLELEFTCSGGWQLSMDSFSKEWLTIASGTDGTGDGKVLLVVSENEGWTGRTSVVTLKSGKYKASVEIRQEGRQFEISFRHPSLAFTEEQFGKIKAAYDAGAPSLKGAVDYIFVRADGAYDPESVSRDRKRENVDMEALFNTAKGPSMLAFNKVIGAKLTDDNSKKAKWMAESAAILVSWATACKDVEYPSYKAGDPDPTTGAGMFISRSMWPLFASYEILRGTSYLTAEQDKIIVSWLRNVEKAIKDSIISWDKNDYFNKQYYQNHLCAHMWGLLSIGYVLEDEELVRFALDSEENPRDFKELIEGSIFMSGDKPCSREKAGSVPPRTGEIYDRYRHQTAPNKGLQYTSLTLQILSSAARTCFNNGIDMYAYTAPTGENIRLCYEFYAPFYEKLDSSLQGGFYSGEDDRISRTGDMKGLFELGLNAYPDSEPIKKVINSIAKRDENKVQMHDYLGFTRLYSIDADSVN